MLSFIQATTSNFYSSARRPLQATLFPYTTLFRSDLDPTPNTITVNVRSVNDAPSGADKTVAINEDSSYTFAAADFGFSDSNDSPANNLLAVKITTLPAAGTLKDNSVAVTTGQVIPVADINGGKLVFSPAAN